MRFALCSLVGIICCVTAASSAPPAGKPGSRPTASAARAVSFSKDIKPLLRSCQGCHNATMLSGGFSLESLETALKGPPAGPVILPGKSKQSKLIAMVSGPMAKMPPGGPEVKLKKNQVALIAAWIDQGAKNDAGPAVAGAPERVVVNVPKISLKVPVLPQAASLAFSKDGKYLAVGLYREVKLFEVANPQSVKVLGGHADVVHCVAFSPDGKYLAAAGGPPAQWGEIKIWDLSTGECVRTIQGHTDFIYAVAWSPDSKSLVSGSYDKLVKVWEAGTGKEIRTLKDHADAVYAVAWSSKGNWIATGSADRSIKVWDAATGKRLYTITGHGDIIYALAFNQAGTQLVSAGADKTIRTWNLTNEKGDAARTTSAHGDVVTAIAFSQTGKYLASASQDKSAKVWDSNSGGSVRSIDGQPEALFSVAISPDDTVVAIGSYDGTVRLFKIADGKPVAVLIDLPKAVEAPKPPAAKNPAAAPKR
jgi:WD40 repeat protein